jgi:type VI secretion system protein ImpJ
MRLLSRVVWSEGMYLAPHHFQVQGRYFEDAIRFVIEHAWFAPWGFTAYQLDEHAIANGRVALQSAYGIFEDGLAFAMDKDCDPLPPERDVSRLLPPTTQTLLVLLAVPRRQEGARNCNIEGNTDHCRYRARNRPIRDVNDGADEKDVLLGEKNIAIVTDQEVDGSMNTIPLARIRRNADGTLGFDPAFIPPCSKLTASEWLMNFLGQLIELLEEKRKVLLVPRSGQGGFRTGLSEMEVSKFWFLHAINDGLAQLRHLHFSKRGHPEELFRELSRVAGALCTFNVESDPANLPVYDHRRLDECFSALGSHIREHLEILVPSNAIEVPIQRSAPNIYAGGIADQRCFGRSRWVLGLGSSAGDAAVMAKAPYLVKICSALFVSELVRRAVPGLSLLHLPVPPTAISRRMDLQYFSISKSGRCWDHILETREIGIYVPDELPDPVIDLQVVLES